MAIRLRMRTSTEVRRALARVANMALNGEVDTKKANTVILACNAVLGAIRIDEQHLLSQIQNKIVKRLPHVPDIAFPVCIHKRFIVMKTQFQKERNGFPGKSLKHSFYLHA